MINMKRTLFLGATITLVTLSLSSSLYAPPCNQDESSHNRSPSTPHHAPPPVKRGPLDTPSISISLPPLLLPPALPFENILTPKTRG